jgi:hypothetical protein
MCLKFIFIKVIPGRFIRKENILVTSPPTLNCCSSKAIISLILAFILRFLYIFLRTGISVIMSNALQKKPMVLDKQIYERMEVEDRTFNSVELGIVEYHLKQ